MAIHVCLSSLLGILGEKRGEISLDLIKEEHADIRNLISSSKDFFQLHEAYLGL